MFLKVTFLTHAWSLGGTDPIVIPTPIHVVRFSARIFSEHFAIERPLLDGLTAIESS